MVWSYMDVLYIIRRMIVMHEWSQNLCHLLWGLLYQTSKLLISFGQLRTVGVHAHPWMGLINMLNGLFTVVVFIHSSIHITIALNPMVSIGRSICYWLSLNLIPCLDVALKLDWIVTWSKVWIHGEILRKGFDTKDAMPFSQIIKSSEKF